MSSHNFLIPLMAAVFMVINLLGATFTIFHVRSRRMQRVDRRSPGAPREFARAHSRGPEAGERVSSWGQEPEGTFYPELFAYGQREAHGFRQADRRIAERERRQAVDHERRAAERKRRKAVDERRAAARRNDGVLGSSRYGLFLVFAVVIAVFALFETVRALWLW